MAKQQVRYRTHALDMILFYISRPVSNHLVMWSANAKKHYLEKRRYFKISKQIQIFVFSQHDIFPIFNSQNDRQRQHGRTHFLITATRFFLLIFFFL